MKAFQRILCLCLMLVMLAGLMLPGHAMNCQISGTVKSFGDADAPVYLSLGNGSAFYEQTVTGNQASYCLTGISSGDYTLRVQKAGHVTRTYEIPIESADSTLDLEIYLKGDVASNGMINAADVALTFAHARGSVLIEDSYKLACADFTGDGRINMADVSSIFAVVKDTYQQPVKPVTLSVWAAPEDLSEDGWLLQMEEDFQKAHPEYKITWVNDCYNEADAAYQIVSDPENAADVYMYVSDQLSSLIAEDAILRLNGPYSEQVRQDNAQALVNSVTYTDNGIYGFPISSNTWFMYYNKSIFTEEDVKSLDTMLTKGKVAFPWSTAWYSGTFFFANGATIFGEKGNDPADGFQFGEDHGGYEAALKMVQLADHPNMVEDINGAGYTGMYSEAIHAYFSGSWDYPMLHEALGDKLGVAVLPTVGIGGEQKQMKAFANSKAVGVNPNADHPELATAFAAYLATADAQKARYEHRGVIPAATELANDPILSRNELLKAEIETVSKAAVVQPAIPEMNNYWGPMTDFCDRIANGDINSDNCTQYVDQLMSSLNSNYVTLTVWAPADDMVEGGWMEAMQEAFAAEHPELEITWNNYSCHAGDAGDLVSTDPEGAADVYQFANDQIGKLVEAGAIQELTGDSRAQVLYDNSQTMVNTVTYIDNGIYGFPVSNNTWIMYYNKDIFTEDDIKSLDTMLDKGKVAFPWSIGWYDGTFFLANGGTLFGDKGIDAEAGIQFGKDNGGYEAARKMVQLAAHPNMIDDINGYGWAGMVNGTLGAYFSGSWDYMGLYEQLGDKLGAVQLPTVEIGGEQKQMKAFAGSKAFGVNPHSDHPELAEAFAAYLATPEAQLLHYQYTGLIPSAISLVNEPEILQNEVAQAEIKNNAIASVVQPSIPEMGNYWTPMGDFGIMIANGVINEGNYELYVDEMMAQFNHTCDEDEEEVIPPPDGLVIDNVTYTGDVPTTALRCGFIITAPMAITRTGTPGSGYWKATPNCIRPMNLSRSVTRWYAPLSWIPVSIWWAMSSDWPIG